MLSVPGFTASITPSVSANAWPSGALKVGPHDRHDVPASMEVVSYDPRWRTLYEVERLRLLMLIGKKIRAVEHIGSTSVPGLCAKPCIDIAVGLDDVGSADDLETSLTLLGYQYVTGHREGRIFGKRRSPSFRLHLVQYAGSQWTGFLAVSSYLRSHPRAALEYCKEKRRLSYILRLTGRGYHDAKSGFLNDIEATARQYFRLQLTGTVGIEGREPARSKEVSSLSLFPVG